MAESTASSGRSLRNRRKTSPLRLCGLSLLALGRGKVKSSGKSAIRSNARTAVPSFSRKMISSPRRKISNSSLFHLNCFGGRAAGLFPDLNTRAVRCVHRRKSPHIPEVCTTTPHEIAKRPASPLSERTAAQAGPCRAEHALLLLQRPGLRQSTECLAVYPSRATTSIFWSLPFWSFTFNWPPSGATTCTFSLR
jgi:hypothetical protein